VTAAAGPTAAALGLVSCAWQALSSSEPEHNRVIPAACPCIATAAVSSVTLAELTALRTRCRQPAGRRQPPVRPQHLPPRVWRQRLPAAARHAGDQVPRLQGPRVLVRHRAAPRAVPGASDCLLTQPCRAVYWCLCIDTRTRSLPASGQHSMHMVRRGVMCSHYLQQTCDPAIVLRRLTVFT